MTSSTRSVRNLAVLALLSYAGLILIFAFFDWLIPSSRMIGLAQRSYVADFVGVFTIALPVLAVLLATRIAPALPNARRVALIALIEYAATLLFGLITLVIGSAYAFRGLGGGIYAVGGTVDGVGFIVVGIAQLAVVAVATLVVLRTFTDLGGRVPGISQPPAT